LLPVPVLGVGSRDRLPGGGVPPQGHVGPDAAVLLEVSQGGMGQERFGKRGRSVMGIVWHGTSEGKRHPKLPGDIGGIKPTVRGHRRQRVSRRKLETRNQKLETYPVPETLMFPKRMSGE
jgi:hypothetical protein